MQASSVSVQPFTRSANMTSIASKLEAPVRNNLSAITGGGARQLVGTFSSRSMVEADMKTSPSRTDNGTSESLIEEDTLRLLALETLHDGIWIARMDGVLTYRNAAAEVMSAMRWWRDGKSATMAELVFESEQINRLRTRGVDYGEYHLSDAAADAHGERRVMLDMQVLRGPSGEGLGLLLQAHDVSREWGREAILQDRHVELEAAYARVK